MQDAEKRLRVDELFRELPAPREQRWNLLKTFFAHWYEPLTSDDGFDDQSVRAAEERLHIDFPAALREWYMLAGKRMDVWSCQDTFLAPDRLRVEENRLIIYVENQSVVTWSIPLNLLAEDDPLVYVSDAQGRNEWIGQSCVSTFALIQMLLATKFSGHAQYTANGQANDRMLASIAQTLQRLDFPDLSFPAYPTRLYAKNDLIVEIDADTWIWVSAKSDETFRAVIDGLSNRGASWEQVTED